MEINLKIKKKSLANINKLFNGKKRLLNLYDDYDSMILEAKRQAAEEEPEPAPSKAKTKRKKNSLELREEFINETKNDKKI